MSDRSPRIAIVDDLPHARELLSALLSREGYELLHFSSGVELLESLEQADPDIILLDVMMPEMDGFEVCKKIRAREKGLHLPIILVTALDSQQDLAQGLNAGADDFLHKPVQGIELRARVRSMLRIKQQFDAAEALLKLREDLAHMIVHDMRSPLTAIVGFTELLKSGIVTAEDTEDIEKLSRQVRRLNTMVNDLLIQAKMEQDKLLLTRSQVDVVAAVQAVIDNLSLVANSRQIEMVVQLPSHPLPMSLDTNLFQRMLDNLLSNALKFSLPNSRITITLESLGQSPAGLRLQVSDQGPGIPDQDRQRIFDKYEIARLKQQDGVPIGLGLAFVKLVVEAHQGKIWVEPNQPNGSVFVVELYDN